MTLLQQPIFLVSLSDLNLYFILVIDTKNKWVCFLFFTHIIYLFFIHALQRQICNCNYHSLVTLPHKPILSRTEKNKEIQKINISKIINYLTGSMMISLSVGRLLINKINEFCFCRLRVVPSMQSSH